MEFSISKGTKLFLMDLLFLYKSSNEKKYQTYQEMLDYLNKGYYDDKRDEDRDSYSKVFHRSCDDFWTTWHG